MCYCTSHVRNRNIFYDTFSDDEFDTKPGSHAKITQKKKEEWKFIFSNKKLVKLSQIMVIV